MASSPFAFLVTGAGGFIGRHLVRALAERFPDCAILAPTVRLTETSAYLAQLPDPPARIDGVFHLAAHTPKDGAPEDGDAVRASIESNVVGLQSLLAAVAGRCDRFVFTSTLDVYRSPADGEVLAEQSALGPATVYGASKLMGESMIRRWAQQHGARIAILRLSHVYGPGEDRYQKLIPATIRRALAGEPLVLSGNGAALRDFIYIKDAVEALLAAWRALERESLEPVNVASGRSVSVEEVLRAVCEEVGGRIEVENSEVEPPPSRSYRFDVTRLNTVLGVSAATPLREGLRAEIEWLRQRRSPHG